MGMKRRMVICPALFTFVFGCVAGAMATDELKIGIMQSKKANQKILLGQT